MERPLRDDFDATSLAVQPPLGLSLDLSDPDVALDDAVPDVVPEHCGEDDEHETDQAWDRDDPEEGEGVSEAAAAGEVHAEVAGDEGERGEEDGDDGEDHHEVVGLGADGVEDERRDVVGAGVHLLERRDHGDAVVEHVAEVGVC